MKIVNIFLASSSELAAERLKLSNALYELNPSLEKEGIRLRVVKWEHLDSSMADEYKQEEYNRALSMCDICVVLYWRVLGAHTYEEHEFARRELQASGRLKRIFSCFKQSKGEESAELQRFRENYCPVEQDSQHDFAELSDVIHLFSEQINQECLRLAAHITPTVAEIPQNRCVSVLFTALDDLREEWAELSDTMMRFETLLEKRFIRLRVERWMHAAGESMSDTHALQYADKIAQSEIVVHLYAAAWDDKLKSYLEQAYARLKEKKNPKKLHVYFKKIVTGSEDLHLFRQSFPKVYGHFYSEFKNAESFILDFILQLEGHLTCFETRWFHIQDQQLYIDDCPLMRFDSIPFAHLNQRYSKLKAELLRCEESERCLLEDLEQSPEDAILQQELRDNARQLAELRDALHSHLTILLNMARRIVQQSSDQSSERSVRAMRYFHMGKVEEALKVLDSNVLQEEKQGILSHREENSRQLAQDRYRAQHFAVKVAHGEELEEKYKKQLERNLKDWHFSLDLVLAHSELSEGEKVERCLVIYRETLDSAERLDYKVIYPQVYRELLERYAKFCDEYHYDKQAISAYSSLIKLAHDLYGLDSTLAADYYTQLGFLLDRRDQGNHSSAAFMNALVIYERMLGEYDLNTIYSYAYVGSAYKKLRDYKRAHLYLQEAYSRVYRSLGKKNRHFANVSTRTGDLFVEQAEYGKALENYFTALEILKLILGRMHDDIAAIYSKIGRAFSIQGEYSKAVKYYLAALEILEQVLGKTHLRTASFYNYIGIVYSNKDENSKALKYYVSALEIYELVVGKIHKDTAMTYNYIGLEYYLIGEYGKALENYFTALEIRKQVLGEMHADTAISYCNIGDVYIEQGEYGKALVAFFNAVNIYENLPLRDEMMIAKVYNDIGWIYDQQDKNIESIDYHQRSLALRQMYAGEESLDTARSYKHLGFVLAKLNEREEALALCRLSLSISKKHLDENDPLIVELEDKIRELSLE